jgi:hypothetical protein
LWVIFALLDPDPDPYSNYGSGSGSTLPIEYGSNTDPDPDPQPWKKICFKTGGWQVGESLNSIKYELFSEISLIL